MLTLLTLALAGGGPASTQVLYAADDPDSEALARFYAVSRQIPENRLCGVSGSWEDSLSWEDFDATIRGPWEACRREDTDVLVLVRGLPYRVELPTFWVSVEAALQVGRGLGSGDVELAGQGQGLSGSTPYATVRNPAVVYRGHLPSDFTLSNPTQSYYTTTSGLVRQEWPRGFERQDRWRDAPYELSGELLVVSRLDAWTYEDATALVTRALQAEEEVPTGTWLCMAAADSARGPRDPECEFAVRKLLEIGVDATWLPTHDASLEGHRVLAYLTGAANLKGAIDGLDYAPGALADNITSFGAVPDNFCETCEESQTSIARFIRAGASAAHGTVAEPLNNVFPSAGQLLLYSQGYALGESVLYNQRYLYWQNLLLGDPLMTPFDARPTVSVWGQARVGQPTVFSGQHERGVQRMELWIEGERVAEQDGDLLEWTFDQEEEVEVLAIAVAKGRVLSTPDWPVAEFEVDPETQGWALLTVDVGPAPLDTQDTGWDTDGPPPSEEDCGGCSSSSSWLAVPAWALVLLSRRRRRGQNGP